MSRTRRTRSPSPEPRFCGVCKGKCNNQATVCHTCVQAAIRRLAMQPGLHDSLETEMARQSRKLAPNDGGKSAETPLPYDPRAGQLIRWQQSKLEGWATTLGVETGDVRHMAVGIAGLSFDWRKRDDAPVLCHDLKRIVEEILTYCDAPQHRARFKVGPCPKVWPVDEGNGSSRDVPCTGQVETLVPADDDAPVIMRCTDCRAEWPSVEFNRTGRLIKQRQAQIEEQRQMAQQLVRLSA